MTAIQVVIRGWACQRWLAQAEAAASAQAEQEREAEAQQSRRVHAYAVKRFRETDDHVIERCSSAPKLQRAKHEQEAPAQTPTSGCPSDAAHPPAQFCCPLTLELLRDPVTLASGQTYERVEVTRWLTEAWRKGQKPRDPLTNAVLKSSAVVPNIALRQLIEMWRDTHDNCTSTCVQPL